MKANRKSSEVRELARRIAKHPAPINIQPDFRVCNEGSILLLHPLSPRAVDWVNEHIGADNGYQPLFPSVLVEPRYLGPILEGIAEAGMAVQ